MKVSFVVPVFKKKADQLKACIKSLREQSHKDIQVVCVFDGPDHGLEEIVKLAEIEDSRISHTVIEHGGAPKARNAGFSLTNGDIVSFWDADSYAEPEMAAMWVRMFKENPDCDFVYSGYKFTNPNAPGFESEPFDPWVLSKYNYISSMFPIKREKFPGWDENLAGLQDWDYWRRVVRMGSKGKFLPGFGFLTDLPDKESISGNSEQTRERIEKIREKHGDANPRTLIYGNLYKKECIYFAKLLNADYFFNQFWRVRDYDSVLMVGFHPWEFSETYGFMAGLKDGVKKIVYWMGLDAEMLFNAPFSEAKRFIALANKIITKSYCDGERTRKILENLGIEAEILPFPIEVGEAPDAMPSKFRVLALADDVNAKFLRGVVSSMPDIDITIVRPETNYDIKEYSVAMQFTEYPRILNATQKVLKYGRHVISNVQEPHAGYVDIKDVVKAKQEIISKVYELKDKRDLNVEAQKYYRELSDPSLFKAEIDKITSPQLEVVK